MAFDNLIVRYARAEGDESVFLTDFTQPDDARHIDQRFDRMLVALLQIEDQISAAGHHAGFAVIVRQDPNGFVNRRWKMIIFPEWHATPCLVVELRDR